MSILNRDKQLKLIENDISNLKYIENQYEDICLKAIRINPFAIKYVKNQTKELCLEAVKNNGLTIQFIDNPTEEICLEAVKNDSYSIKYIENQTEDICLEAVKKVGINLRYVKNQTERICIEAVKKEGYSIIYVNEKNRTRNVCLEAVKSIQHSDFLTIMDEIEYQDREICIEAIRKNAFNLRYVKEPTYEAYLEAVKRNGETIKLIKNRVPELCFYSYLNKTCLGKYKYIKDGVSKFIKKNSELSNKVFCINRQGYYTLKARDIEGIDVINISSEAFKDLKNYLLASSNNYYIVSEHTDLDIIKELALSNNIVICVKLREPLKEAYTILSNKVIEEGELEEIDFKIR